jgi:hypothetical protein
MIYIYVPHCNDPSRTDAVAIRACEILVSFKRVFLKRWLQRLVSDEVVPPAQTKPVDCMSKRGLVRKISTLLGFDPRTVEPVARHYTD